MGKLLDRPYKNLPWWPGLVFILLIVCPLFLFVFTSPPIERHASAVRPDILLITIDTLRADRLGCYGCPDVQTPTLDRLSKRASLFSHAITTSPETVPAHASLLTGLLPSRHGAFDNRHALDEHVHTMAEILQLADYTTAAVTNAILTFMPGFSQGFDRFNERSGDSPPTEEKPVLAPYVDTLLTWDANAGRDPLSAERTSTRALAALQDPSFTAEQPRFLWVHFWDPHLPYDPPELMRLYYECPRGEGREYFDTEELHNIHRERKTLSAEDLRRLDALYNGDVSWCDRHLDELLRAFQASKGAVPLIIVAGDHGEALFDADHYIGHGLSIGNDSLNVPLIITGGLQVGSILEEAVSLIDVLPTVLFLIDAPNRAPDIQGRVLPGFATTPAGEQRTSHAARSWAHQIKVPATQTNRWKVHGPLIGQAATIVDLHTDRTAVDIDDMSPPGATAAVSGEFSELLDDFRHWQEELRVYLGRSTAKTHDQQIESMLQQLGYIDFSNTENTDETTPPQ